MTQQNQNTYSNKAEKSNAEVASEATDTAESSQEKPKEVGGPAGPEPTRYGDWEIGGKCVDF